MDFIKDALKNKLGKGLKLKVEIIPETEGDKADESAAQLDKKADGLAPDTEASKKIMGKAELPGEAEGLPEKGPMEEGDAEKSALLEKILAALPGAPNGRKSMTLDERAKEGMRGKLAELKNKA